MPRLNQWIWIQVRKIAQIFNKAQWAEPLGTPLDSLEKGGGGGGLFFSNLPFIKKDICTSGNEYICPKRREKRTAATTMPKDPLKSD